MDENEPNSESVSSPTKDERNWALVAHLGALVASLISAGLLSFVLPLVIYLAKRDDSEFIADQARESLNFRITLLLAYLLNIPLIFLGIGLCILPVIYLTELVLGIVAAVKSYDGERYRYPFSFRLVN